jgi:hypothetical protein
MERLGKIMKLFGIKIWSANSQDAGRRTNPRLRWGQKKSKGNYDEEKEVDI